MQKERIKLRDLKATPKTQTREELNAEALADYKAHVKLAVSKGADPEFDPLVAFRDPIGGEIFLADGFHRRQALLAYDVDAFDVEVHDSEDPKRDAIKYGFTANIAHGVRLTNADKKHNLNLALEDAEWSQLSNNALAELVGVSEFFVRQNRPVAKKPVVTKAKNGSAVDTSNIGKKGGSAREKKKAEKAAAKKEGKPAKKGKAPAAPAEPKVDAALEQALTKISKAIDGNGFVGANIVAAIRDGTLPMSSADVKKMAATSADRICTLAPLVFNSRWSVAKALSFIDKAPDADTKAVHFINLAIAHGGIVRERVENATCIWLISDNYSVGESKDGTITIKPKK